MWPPRRANESGPMAKAAGVGKGLLRPVRKIIALCSILFAPIFRGERFRVRRRAGDSVGIREPARQIAVLAALRAERVELRCTRLATDGAGLGCGEGHDERSWAFAASIARAGSTAISTTRPVRRANSSSHSGLSLDLSAG